jgi:CheY-like chemotaxis protein
MTVDFVISQAAFFSAVDGVENHLAPWSRHGRARLRGRLAMEDAGARDIGGHVRHVLLIDDEPDFCDVVELVLSGLDLEVTAVASGRAALVALGRRRYDLVITDLRMPGMSGSETITALHEVDADVPVVIASGCSVEEARATCALSGARGFLRKPFNLTDLVSVVTLALDAHRCAEAPPAGAAR